MSASPMYACEPGRKYLPRTMNDWLPPSAPTVFEKLLISGCRTVTRVDSNVVTWPTESAAVTVTVKVDVTAVPVSGGTLNMRGHVIEEGAFCIGVAGATSHAPDTPSLVRYVTWLS